MPFWDGLRVPKSACKIFEVMIYIDTAPNVVWRLASTLIEMPAHGGHAPTYLEVLHEGLLMGG